MAGLKVWVLTREVNEHNQYGEYFETVFTSKPSVKALADYFSAGALNAKNVMEAVALLEHIRNGGGRCGTEHTWYTLNEVEVTSGK